MQVSALKGLRQLLPQPRSTAVVGIDSLSDGDLTGDLTTIVEGFPGLRACHELAPGQLYQKNGGVTGW